MEQNKGQITNIDKQLRNNMDSSNKKVMTLSQYSEVKVPTTLSVSQEAAFNGVDASHTKTFLNSNFLIFIPLSFISH